jgi:putative ABC transport system permease protein
MFIYNLKHAIRSLLKSKLFTSFNLIGFSVALTVCIVTALYIYHEYSMDDFYNDTPDIYRLVDVKNNSVEIDRNVASSLKEKFPEIKMAVPLYNFKSEDFNIFLKDPLRHNAIKLKNTISTTNDFFSLANVKTIVSKSGEPIADNKSIVLSRETALKLFGKTEIIGESVQIDNNVFPVSAVVENLPPNSSLDADVYISTDHPDYSLGSTCSNGVCFLRRNILISVANSNEISSLIKKMNLNFPVNKSNTTTVDLQPLRSIYFSPVYEGSPNKAGNVKMILLLVSVAVLVLIMSIINYLNFSISKQLITLKDSGIKIANGAGVRHIREYYAMEVGLTILISFAMALLIAKTTLPFFQSLINEKLNFSWIINPHLLIPFAAIILLVVVTASLATLSFTSNLSPNLLFKKVYTSHEGMSIKRIFTVVQLTVSMGLITSLFFINKQLSYVKGADIGFKKEQLLRIDIPWAYKDYVALKTEYAKLPFVSDLCLTSHSPGAGWSKNGIVTKSEKRVEVNTINIDDDFLKTFRMIIIAGRGIEPSDLNYGCLISSSTYKALEWDNIDDKKFNGLKVLGIVNDININSLHSGIVPIAFQYTDDYYSAINLRLQTGITGQQMKEIEKVWKELLPYDPMTFAFYDEYFNSLYKKEDRQSQALAVFTVIAFIITCLGMLGQIMQTSQRRVKEIGIRKINGATVSEIITLLNRDYMIEVIIAILVATPIIYFSVRIWLNNFAYKTDLSWYVFAAAGLLSFLITILTVTWQSWRAATRNPVEALRYE